MGKRITITMDDDIVEKIREIQASKINSSIRSVSFSHVVNQILKDALKANGFSYQSFEINPNQNRNFGK
jgi:hypothetical protein